MMHVELYAFPSNSHIQWSVAPIPSCVRAISANVVCSSSLTPSNYATNSRVMGRIKSIEALQNCPGSLIAFAWRPVVWPVRSDSVLKFFRQPVRVFEPFPFLEPPEVAVVSRETPVNVPASFFSIGSFCGKGGFLEAGLPATRGVSLSFWTGVFWGRRYETFFGEELMGIH